VRSRFLSEDPLGFWGGINNNAYAGKDRIPPETNLYRYARNNPFLFTDPYGLWSWSNFGIGLAQVAEGIQTIGIGGAMVTGTAILSGGNIPLTVGMGVLSLPVWAAGILELQHGVERLAEELRSLEEQAPESERCGTYPRRG